MKVINNEIFVEALTEQKDKKQDMIDDLDLSNLED
jgi:hypothetical protein